MDPEHRPGFGYTLTDDVRTPRLALTDDRR